MNSLPIRSVRTSTTEKVFEDSSTIGLDVRQQTNFRIKKAKIIQPMQLSELNQQTFVVGARSLSSVSSPAIRARCVDIIKQHWHGEVLEDLGETFTMIIRDQTEKNNPDEIVEISKEEIERHDWALINPGAQLNWYIGYKQGNLVPRETFSAFRFRRLPAWSQEEIDRAEALAKEDEEYFAID